MGIGIVILFWAVVAGFLISVYFVLALVGRRFAAAAFLKKVLVALVGAVAIPLVAWAIISFAAGFFPSVVFKSNLGFFPPRDVVELHGRQLIIGDSGEAYLRFRASRETVQRILGDRFFEIGKPDARFDQFPSPDSPPSYWHPLEGSTVRFFKSAETFDDRFHFSQAFLSYDESNGTVHFYWHGVD